MILAVLATIWFISYTNYVSQSKVTKLTSNLHNITLSLEVGLSSWKNLDLYLSWNTITDNWITPSSTIHSGAYLISDITYKVGNINFQTLQLNKDDFIKNRDWVTKEYIFAYTKFSNKKKYQIAWELGNSNWLNDVYILGKYKNISSTDTHWLISEKWFTLWLISWMTLTWSLY